MFLRYLIPLIGVIFIENTQIVYSQQNGGDVSNDVSKNNRRNLVKLFNKAVWTDGIQTDKLQFVKEQSAINNPVKKEKVDPLDDHYLDSDDDDSSVVVDSDGDDLTSGQQTDALKDKKKNSTRDNTENAKKKQYATDDFQAETMPHNPIVSSPVNFNVNPEEDVHVTEDFHSDSAPPLEHLITEPIHHHDEPCYPYCTHIEEPVYVHHVAPPPPPPPEPIMIPIPVVASPPPPPPPPPPPCTVHIPVVIHLRGKLAIKMKHCKNCDFSKNIESIGPLKIAPINGLKSSIKDTDSNATKRTKFEQPKNILPITLKEAFLNSHQITYDDDNTVTATKKDITKENDVEKRVLVVKPFDAPSNLLPQGAFKRGVVISLPKGKALLKCVVARNTSSWDSTNLKVNDKASNETASQSELRDALTATSKHFKAPVAEAPSAFESAPPSSSMLTSSVIGLEALQVLATTAAPEKQESHHHQQQKQQQQQHSLIKTTEGDHVNKSTEGFLKLLDKDMMVSLYKMAVRDILNELHNQKDKKKNIIIRNRISSLETEQNNLESKYPGIIKSLIHFSDQLESRLYPRRLNKLFSSIKYTTKRSSPDEAIYNSVEDNSKLKLLLEKPKFLNDTRRVELVDTDLHLKKKLAQQHSKHTKVKANALAVKPMNNAFSFYGDLDPTKLIDDSAGTPLCVDPYCEKNKQFLSHAGEYFENLDSLALAPYKQFMSSKGRDSIASDDPPKVFQLPYGETINVEGLKKRSKTVVVSNNGKRESILDANEPVDTLIQPSTIVELFGKLPRVPLKITLNPKGPLAKLKKPIEIDLRPPGKGEPASKMIATANDPKVAVHIANKIFKEDPLDPKQEEKLQSVYADIKKRSLPKHYHKNSASLKHVYVTPSVIHTNNATSRMRIVVSLPKEITRLVSLQNNIQHRPFVKTDGVNDLAHKQQIGVVRNAPSTLNFKTFYLNRDHLPSSVTESTNQAKESSKNTVQKVEVTDLNKVQRIVEADSNESNNLSTQTVRDSSSPKAPVNANEIERYEKTLKTLQEQTKSAFEKFKQLKEKKDPYADIGKKRSEDIDPKIMTTAQAGADKLKSKDINATIVKTDPYSDIGKKRSEVTDAETAKTDSHGTDIDKKRSNYYNAKKVKTDPYSDVGASVRSISRRSAHTQKKNRKSSNVVGKKKDRVPPSDHVLPHQKINIEPVEKDNVPPGVGAISFVRHTAKKHNDDDLNATAANLEASVISAFPHFKEALEKINPSTKNKLFQMEPFKFLSHLETKENKTVEPISDPYADLGSSPSQTTNKRSKQHRYRSRKKKVKRNSKRSETYDPYADLGTSIGLSQNESRMKKTNDTATETSEASNKNVASAEKDEKESNKQDNSKQDNNISEVSNTNSTQTNILQKTTANQLQTKVEHETAELSPDLNIKTFDKNVATAEVRPNDMDHHSRYVNIAAVHDQDLIDPYADLGASSYESQLPNPVNKSATVTDKLINNVSEKTDKETKTKQASPIEALVTAKALNRKPSIADKLVEKFVLPVRGMLSANLQPKIKSINARLKLNEASETDNDELASHDMEKSSAETSNSEQKVAAEKSTTDSSNSERNVSAEKSGSESSNSEKDGSAEKDLATIERLEKDIAAEKMKSEPEASDKPVLQKIKSEPKASDKSVFQRMKSEPEASDKSVLQKNVGKEIQGPYADLGGGKKKTLDKYSVRKSYASEKSFASKVKNSTLAEKSEILKVHPFSHLMKRMNVKKCAQNRIYKLFLQQARQHLKESENVHTSSVSSERDVDRFIGNTDKKHKQVNNCTPRSAEETMKFLKVTAEHSVNKLTRNKNLHTLNGTSSRKSSVPPLCDLPVIKEIETEQQEAGIADEKSSYHENRIIKSNNHESRTNEPNNHESRTNEPNNHESRTNEPNNHESRTNEPENHESRTSEPNNHESRINEPNNHESRINEPSNVASDMSSVKTTTEHINEKHATNSTDPYAEMGSVVDNKKFLKNNKNTEKEVERIGKLSMKSDVRIKPSNSASQSGLSSGNINSEKIEDPYTDLGGVMP